MAKQKQKPITHLKRSNFAEFLGWIGAFALLTSYALLSFGIIGGDTYLYHGMLLIGSIGLAIITYRHQAYQSFIVNTIFSLLAGIALLRLLMVA